MIVRLKDGVKILQFFNRKMFQFYDSPIKSLLAYRLASKPRTFQFYDSPIKRDFAKLVKWYLSCFNSMIVRLKGKRTMNVEEIFISFQFYDSPIKRIFHKNINHQLDIVSIL